MVLAAAVAFGLIGWLGGPTSPDLAPVVVADGGIVGGAQVGDEVFVVTRLPDALDSSPGSDSSGTRILTVSAASGDITSSADIPLTGPIEGVAVFDGKLVFRSVDPVAGLPAEIGHRPNADELGREPGWLVLVDLETMTPVSQYALPAFDRSIFEPLVVVNGIVHVPGNSRGEGTIDLRTGAVSIVEPALGPSVVDIRRLDDELLILRPQRIDQFDLATGEPTLEHRFRDQPNNALRPGRGFRYHRGEFWMSGLAVGEVDRLYRYDLDRGELLGPPRPARDFPAQSRELGPNRWELYRPDTLVPLLHGRTVEPEPDDLWRQVDIATDEIVAEFDFGDWSPRFATEDRLWLTRDVADGPGQELAPLDLAD